ncbi:MAG: DNA polymerase III subunit beta [Verrucomicrobiae bacterium]|nr:DNA polymerase III subunit beta [Verrucomicrobiae bacterium]
MNITIAKEQIQSGLQIVQNAVAGRSNMPILSNVLLNAEGDTLELTGTDLDMTVSCKVKAQINTPGKTTLPAKRLLSIVRELPGTEIQIYAEDESKYKIESGPAKFKIYALPASDFPQIRQIKEDKKIKFTQEKLKEMLRRTGFAAAQEEGRYLLTGTYIEMKDQKTTVVATDGRRLALVEEDVDIPADMSANLIIPIRGVNELNRLLSQEGDVELVFMENFARFYIRGEKQPTTEISVKLIDGVYPNYKQVVPAESKYRIEIMREEFLSVLKRAELVTSEKNNSVKLTLSENTMTVTTNTPEVGDFLESIAVRFNGEEFSIAFNPAYLIDALSVLTEDVIFFELTDHMSPGVIKINGPFLYVVMPMRLQE